MDHSSAERRHERRNQSRKRPDPDSVESGNRRPSNANSRPTKRQRVDIGAAPEPQPQPGWPTPAPAPAPTFVAPSVAMRAVDPHPQPAPPATTYHPYRLIDLTAEDPGTPPRAPTRQREDDVVVVGERNHRPAPLGFTMNLPMIVLDVLMNQGAHRPQPPPPVDLSGGYWARRKAGKLLKDEVGAGEDKPAEKSTEGTLPGKDCPICLSPISDITAAVCGHVFCEECIMQAIHHQGKCPKCRRALTAKDIHPLFL